MRPAAGKCSHIELNIAHIISDKPSINMNLENPEFRLKLALRLCDTTEPADNKPCIELVTLTFGSKVKISLLTKHLC